MTAPHLHVLTTWTAPDGSRASHKPAAVGERDVWPEVIAGLAYARRARGTDVLVSVLDDLTWQTVAVVRPGEARA